MSARILVVDDTPLNVKLLTAKLMHDYYVVLTAEDGATALEIAKQEKPDLILLDIMMPDMDGFEVCRRLKTDESTKHIPVVMVTALSDVADRVKGLEAGADDFLTKPINDTALMARVRSLLRLKMVMDEWRLREETTAKLSSPILSNKQEAPYKVMILEDSELDTAALLPTIQKLTSIAPTEIHKMDEALAEAKTGNYDLVISSLDLQDEDGLYFCAQLRANESTRLTPLLLIGTEAEINRIAKGLDLGANDYVLRPMETTELLTRMRTQCRQKRHHDKLKENYEQSLTLALIDPLTGAYNRRYLDIHLPRMYGRYSADKKPITIITIDIDLFKKVNDTYGHDAGDAVIKEVVKRITQSIRALDLVARTGGEEFSIIMPEADTDAAAKLGERIREKVASSPIFISDSDTQGITVSVSLGVATTNYESDKSIADAVKRSDAALYHAKKSGRNRVETD